MLDTIPRLTSYDDATLEAFFGEQHAQMLSEAAALTTKAARDAFDQRWRGRKQGRLRALSGERPKSNSVEENKHFGFRFNELKEDIDRVLDEFDAKAVQATVAQATHIDITLPGLTRVPGIPHPLIETMHAVVEVFENLGYSVDLGPEVETDFYNFEALNFPPNHPARDTQDTLLIAHQQGKPARDRLLLRTHTSPVQIRSMISGPPPLRIVIPGKVHRNDAADATHSPIFHQIEGLAVDTGITFSDLKGTLDHAMKALFGHDVKTRFFPSFFPFTEPSADVQISCIFCGGRGCRKCKHSGWIELLGCGMVDPAVFATVTAERLRLGLDPSPYNPSRGPDAVRGFAFGMGVERIAMILHGVSDIGQFYSGDMRFLQQFA